MALFALAPKAYCTDWYIDANIPSSGNGSSWAEAFKTINEGIVVASGGDTLYVASGIYNERLVIGKQLTFIGSGSEVTILQPLDTPTAGVYDIEIDASGTTFREFQFDFNGAVDSRSGNGIVVSDMNDPPVTNVQILNNKIYSGHANTCIQTGKYSDVSGLMISGNTFYGDTDGMGEGVYVNPYTGTGDVIIENNTFYGYLFSGVSIESSNVQVLDNMIDSNVAQGIYGIRVIDLTGGENYTNILIKRNDIQNAQYSIRVGTSTDLGSILTATIESNILSNNDIGIWARYGSDTTIITNNDISGNLNYGISYEGTGFLIAENNWWGDPSGPFHPTTNPSGLGATVSDNVDYDPWITAVTADFSANPTSGEVPLLVQFTDLSTGPVIDYYWEFGDGQTSTDQNPLHEFQVQGDYTVKLTVTTTYGSDLRGKVDYIHVSQAPPIADFSANLSSGLAPLTVTFTDQSIGAISNWSWDFDNDSIIDSNLQNPSYTYNTPGTYTVALIVTGPGGADLKEKLDYINVTAGPIANFTASPTSGMASLTVNFTDQSSGTINTWAWDFDNDTFIDSNEQNPSFTYNTPGTYTVSLSVTDPNGSDVKEQIDYIHVSTTSITADFNAIPTIGVAPLTVNFTDQSSGTINTWAWFLDNDAFIDSTEQNPSFTYNTPGIYTVTLNVVGPDGSDVRQRTDYILVTQAAPIADFYASPTTGIAPVNVQFTDMSIGTVTDYYWEFGDGGTSIDQNPIHEYQVSGDYTVKLTVIGPGGSDVRGKVDYIHISDAPPIADFTANPTSGNAPLTVQFTDLSTGVITDYYWEFGDGHTSTEQNPIHEYQEGGDYTIKLTVTGPGGSEFKGKIDYIHVDDEPPVADFSASPLNGLRPLTVYFANLSTGVITDYFWEFGDGYTSTNRNPVHDYHLPGDYSVTLTVTGPNGADIRGKIDYIHVTEAPPIADFIASPTIVARDTIIQFTDLSPGVITDYYWEFGDGNSSIEQHPSYAYQLAGDYNIRLTVTGPGGSDILEKTNYINVSTGPVAEFSASPSSGTRPLIVQFTDSSMGTITDYYWEFGDGQTSSLQNPSNIYQASGDYTVRLTVTGPDGSDIKEQTNYVHVSDEIYWAKTYGAPTGLSDDIAQSIQSAGNGGFIVAGWAAFGGDIWLSQLNSDGTIRWQKAYDGGNVDQARSIRPTSDGGFIVTGETYSFGDGLHSDIWISKLNEDGSPAWERIYGDSSLQRAYAIEPTFDGGYIVAGESNPGFLNKVWVLKLNFNSTVAWQKTYSTMTGTDRSYSIKPTTDGGYILTGESSYEFWIVKLNSDGSVAWEKKYNTNGSWNKAYSIQETSDNGYIIAGEGIGEFCVLKLFSDGTVDWQKAYGEAEGYGAAYAIRETRDNKFIAVGTTSSFGFGGYDSWMLKLDLDGSILWQKTYGGAFDEKAYSVQQTPDDGFIVAGSTESFGEGSGNFPDIWILRVDPNGDIPDCSAMGTSNAIITDPAFVIQDTSAIILDTNILPRIVNINPFDTSVLTSTICSASTLSQANFTANPNTGYKPLMVQFTDLSTGINTDWFWNFGDGGTSIEQNPSYIYTEDGTYSVSLTINGPEGLDTETKTDYIQVNKTTDFIASPLTGIAPLTVFFMDQSIGNITDWFWDFGDGKTSIKQNPSHIFYDLGYYTVSLTVTDESGSETEIKTDYIYVSNYGNPFIRKLKPDSSEPAKKIRIRGYNFGDVQGTSIVHINSRTFDINSPKIKLWSNKKISIKIPNFPCEWFKGKDKRRAKVWVTVNGIDSNIVKLKVIKPAICP